MAKLQTSIEPSQGSIIENPGEEQILSILNKFGRGVEHCNFTYGDSFVSAYGSSPEEIFLMFIGQDGTEYNSDAIDANTACRVFMDSAEGNTGWKEKIGFNAGDGGGPGSAEAAGTAGGMSGKKSLKEEMLNAVKSEAAYNARRMVRKGIRGLFGKRF
ncbi:MAG: hypothetical protein ACLFMZ_06360 [Spirochaetaceae bacterium]